MNTKEKFKDFVKLHPILLNYVKNNTMTWQKFYEIYDIYGENNEIWNEYIKPVNDSAQTSFDLLGFLKSLDLNSIEEELNSVQRVVGLLQDMHTSPTPHEVKKPRPIYKHFED